MLLPTEILFSLDLMYKTKNGFPEGNPFFVLFFIPAFVFRYHNIGYFLWVKGFFYCDNVQNRVNHAVAYIVLFAIAFILRIIFGDINSKKINEEKKQDEFTKIDENNTHAERQTLL